MCVYVYCTMLLLLLSSYCILICLACRHIAEVKAENVCKEASSYLCPKVLIVPMMRLRDISDLIL